MTIPLPPFPAFYRAIHGFDPFPWQARLANDVVETERWPQEIGVPTGLGKTACLDIAIWWLASQAHRPPDERTAPTRIWWVVNRRLLVDSTTEQAKSLADAFYNESGGTGKDKRSVILGQVANRLRMLSADQDAPPLEVISLRGGIASRSPTDPSRPTVVLCTLPMYGSRLLFRGYGSSLRPVDAAMAGTDSLVLLDEAHLAPHLKSLIKALGDCNPQTEAYLNAARSAPAVVALTATGEAENPDRFDLNEDDLRNAIVRERLDSIKPMQLHVEQSGDMAKHLADAAIGLMNESAKPASFIVFANSPKIARAAFKRILNRKFSSGQTPDVLLLTGRTREREAERIRARILDPMSGIAAGGNTIQRERHFVVVATQTLEAGADIDAEYLVTECCGIRALTQRLGRLNRLGHYPHARAAYVHVSPKRGSQSAETEWPIYGTEPAEVLARLQTAEQNGFIQISPRQVAQILGQPCEKQGRAPEILPGILWEWVKTTTPPDGEAPVDPYFSGIATPEYTVSLIWRIHLPDERQRLWPRAMDREAIDVPLGEFKKIIDEDETIHCLASDGVTVETTVATNLRPGQQVILPTSRGLLDEFGWNPDSTDPVVDVSLEKRGFPLHTDAIRSLCGISIGSVVEKVIGNSEEVDPVEQQEAIEKILTVLRDTESPPGWESSAWSDYVDSLESHVVEARLEVPRLPTKNPHPEPRIYELDETSLGAKTQLAPHGRAVGQRAAVVARHLGLPQSLRRVIKCAGTLHDIGKADSRFQRWLDPDGTASVPMAKSNSPRHCWESMRAKAGWPRGGRHEDLSARLVQAWLKDNPDWATPIERDLLIHLVISHHGKGRPLVPPVRDGTHRTVIGEIEGTEFEVAADLAIADWNQPARFRRLNQHFGPWGLALLEAMVIRSDHAVSAFGNTELEMS